MERQSIRRLVCRQGLATLLLSAAITGWFFPSNIPELIADQQHVLLGRYSVERFASLALSSLLACWMAIALWRRTNRGRERIFRLVAVSFSILVGFTIAELSVRAIRTPNYVHQAARKGSDWPGGHVSDGSYHRRPNLRFELTYQDVPATRRTYPNAPPGFPAVDLTLTTDVRGFRNQTTTQRVDVVAVGDSFTEGSRVSDDEVWTALVERQLDRSVYNLGISGTSLDQYLDNFCAYVDELRPATAVFMIYEGNDLRGSGRRGDSQSLGNSFTRAVKSSAALLLAKRGLIRLLGPVGAQSPVPQSDLLSWMPVAVESDRGTSYYTFNRKRLAALNCSESDYRNSAEWESVAHTLRAIHERCQEKGVRLTVAYAPSTPHVVLPLVRHSVSDAQIAAFIRRRGRETIAESPLTIFDRLDAIETVVAEFCRAEKIGFVSTTVALRDAMARGEQVYYTYDQHWTKLGHAVAARLIAERLRSDSSSATLSAEERFQRDASTR